MKPETHHRQPDPPGMETAVFEQLSESFGECLAEAAIDREQGVVRNVALLGPESKNGYRYTLEAMQQAVPLYDQRPVFVDHPQADALGVGSNTDRQAVGLGSRSVRDYAGRVIEPRFDGERIRGDLHLAGPNTEWLLALIESAPRDLGMSHVVLARWNGDGTAVEHIERVVSVDIVAFPATTQSFVEGDAGTPGRGDAAKEGSLAIPASGCRRVSGSGLPQLVEASRIPSAARNEELYRLLEKCPRPEELVALLESYWQSVLGERSETPRSEEKTAPALQDSAGLRPPLAKNEVRKRLVAAIRGSP